MVQEKVMTIYIRTNSYHDSLEIGHEKKFLVKLQTYLTTNKFQFQETISSSKTKISIEKADLLLK